MARVEGGTNVLASPQWAGDFGGREHLMPFPAKIDPAQFTDQAGVLVKANGAAAEAATSITVDALSDAIPNGTVLRFTPGAGKFAKLTAEAAKGATSITVEALPTAIADNDEARYTKYGTLFIPSGTPIGRTLAERDANTAFGPAVDTDAEIFLSAFDVVDANNNSDVELYRPRSLVKENYLPGYADIAGALLTKLRTVYQCIKGVN